VFRQAADPIDISLRSLERSFSGGNAGPGGTTPGGCLRNLGLCGVGVASSGLSAMLAFGRN
jgi:hypothetical protein